MSKASLVFIFGLLLSNLSSNGQVITTDPLFPSADDSVRIIFNANEGNRGLAGFAGPIWAHTGVITSQSSTGSDWRYVVANWNQNLDKAKLTSLGNDLWELKIGPSIRSYYGVPSNVKILKLAFVFRNQDGSRQGKDVGGLDIFKDVYEPGLNLIRIQPQTDFVIADPGQIIPIRLATTGSDSIVLFHDGKWRAKSETRELNVDMPADSAGLHEVKIIAWSANETVQDSFQYYIKDPGFFQEVPPGMRDGINYTDSTTALLVLQAPGKDHVFVIGDFTDWKINPDYLMKQTPDKKRFWIRLDSLVPRKEYVFQYLVDGNLRIADPYANKVSDPWNDSFIGSTVYPGLIPYPAGKTSQIASVLQTAQAAYSWKVPDFKAPDVSRLVIYELLVRDFTKCHTFSCMLDTLPYLKSLGVNAIELMPVNEFEGNDSWGYNPSFYFAPDKYYGPAEDLKKFIDRCHEMGMAVIIDMVLNHSYGQSPLVRLYWDDVNSRPAADNLWYNVESPNTTYSWGYDFNHESIYTQQFVDSVNTYWLQEYNVDGFRFDFTKGFTNTPGDGGGYDAKRINILKRMYDRIRLIDPDAFVILEHFADNNEEKVLSSYGMLIWGNANYNYRKASSSYFLDGKSDFSSVSWKKRGWTVPHLVGYMESHDEERLMYECYYWGNMANPAYPIKDTTIALRRMELDANFFIPVPGPKMIWMFGELGYDYSINFNGRVGAKPIRWDYQNDNRRKRLYQVYSALNRLKQDLPVFSTADYTLNFTDTVKLLQLSGEDMHVTLVGNYGIRNSSKAPGFPHTGWWYEYWSGDSIDVTGLSDKITLKPGEYRLYSDVRIGKPDIINSKGDIFVSPVEAGGLSVYPNPSSGRLYVQAEGFSGTPVSLRIMDLQGRQVRQVERPSNIDNQAYELDVSDLDDGVYILELRSGQTVRVARWLKSKR